MTFTRVRHTVTALHFGSPSLEDPVGEGGGLGGQMGGLRHQEYKFLFSRLFRGQPK